MLSMYGSHSWEQQQRQLLPSRLIDARNTRPQSLPPTQHSLCPPAGGYGRPAGMKRSILALDETVPHLQSEHEDLGFDLFEPGNPWTQTMSTQVQRQIWRREVYLESQTISPPSQPVEDSVTSDQATGEGQVRGSGRPWWSSGKTAPLLSDFDGARRAFYLAQAGVGVDGDGRHHQHTHQGHKRTDDDRTGSALSLAGNANSPSADTSLSSHTPRKKTWDGTWGESGERKSSKLSTPVSKDMPARRTPGAARKRGRKSARM